MSRDNEERPGDATADGGVGAENFTVGPPEITDSPWTLGATPPGQPDQPGQPRQFDQPGLPGQQRILASSDDPGYLIPEHKFATSDQHQEPASRAGALPTEVTVYTAEDDGEELRDAVADVLELCGFEIVLRIDPESGSWFQKLWVFRRDPHAADKLVEVLQKVERAAELKHIAAPRSESDEREANAVARLAEALGGHNEVVVRLSSVLFVKTGGRVVARVLTEDEIRALDENPQLLRSPMEILEALSQLRETRGAAVRRGHGGRRLGRTSRRTAPPAAWVTDRHCPTSRPRETWPLTKGDRQNRHRSGTHRREQQRSW